MVCAVLGVVIEFCAYKPLRQAAPLSVLITAIGVSYLLQNAALLLFGSQQMAYPTLVKLGSFSVGGVQVDGITVLTLAVTAVLMAALTLFIDKTKLGKAMRAVSEDKEAIRWKNFRRLYSRILRSERFITRLCFNSYSV